LSVAAIDQFGNLADFSNWGPSTVDVAAPGVDILSTIPGGFASYSGTSMASPYVAGVASLVLSTHPQFSASQVVAAIVSSAKPLPSLTGMVISGGTVSAYRALTIGVNNVLGIPNTPPAPPTYTSDQIEGFILASDEFWSRAGSTNSGFVTALYHSLLGRDPDARGLSDWTNAMNAGTSRAQVIQGFQTSLEAATTKVARWYTTYFGLKQSLDSLKANPYVLSWAQSLMSGGTNESLQASLITSSTYASLHGDTSDGVVSGWYDDLLGRPADAGGLATWSNVLATSSNPFNVARAFQAGSESKLAEVARMYQVDLGRGGSIDSLKQDQGVAFWSAQLRI
jgi:subtilisin family serine protease